MEDATELPSWWLTTLMHIFTFSLYEVRIFPVGAGGYYPLAFSLLLVPHFSWGAAGKHTLTASLLLQSSGKGAGGKLIAPLLSEGGRTSLESFFPGSPISSLYHVLGEGFEPIPCSF